ncbi:MAG TPA: ABC transporter permease [Candidatus Hydrogenedentes bacterium]|nr:ABC transporter permease [Candidatus Hydrogenedentota bacterium]HRT65379.1 ABC transporter permease [Candidatus Hydrogenedentota bacterium]
MRRMSALAYTSEKQGDPWRIVPDLLASRGLLRDVVWRELRARYRNAMMGFLWAVVQPVLMMAILLFVFGYLLGDIMQARGLRSERPSAVFLLCGLVPWQFLAVALACGTHSLIESQELIKKVYFPREIIPLAAVVNCLVNFFVGFVTLLVFIIVRDGVSALGAGLFCVPFIFAIQFMLVLGLALLLSALNVHYRDVGYMVDVVLAFGFYATPIFYPLGMVSSRLDGFLFNLYMLNPMANLVTAYRQALLDNVFPEPMLLLRPLVVAVLCLLIGAVVFRRNAPTLADYL